MLNLVLLPYNTTNKNICHSFSRELGKKTNKKTSKTCLPDKLANQTAASQQCETFLDVYLRKLSLLAALYGKRVLTIHSALMLGSLSGLAGVPCHLVIPIWQAWSPHAGHLRGWPCSTPLIAHQQF